MSQGIDPLPCPFCGADPEVNRQGKRIDIGCKSCHYQRSWAGCMQRVNNGIPIGNSGLYYYHAGAYGKAVAAWNQRAVIRSAT